MLIRLGSRNAASRRVRSHSAILLRLALGTIAIGLVDARGSQTATAQAPTTVQLPTFQEFSVSTTVSVPDRGSLILGGVSRSAASSVSRGTPGLDKLPGASRLFKNRAGGRDTSASTAAVTAQIHDFAELDAATLAAARRGTTRDAVDRKAEFLTKHLGRNASAR